MSKYTVKNRYNGNVCFEGDSLSGADLRNSNLGGAALIYDDLSGTILAGADMSSAVLWGANLRNADLTGAYLEGADLSRSYLSGADLRGADLSRADLKRADMAGANLAGADLNGCIGEGKRINTMQAGGYDCVLVDGEELWIGSDHHKVKDWFRFDESEILGIGGAKLLEFWNGYQLVIKALAEAANAAA